MIPYKLKDWIDKSKLDWSNLTLNDLAFSLLDENKDKIDIWLLGSNPNSYLLILDCIKEGRLTIDQINISNHPDLELLHNKFGGSLNYFWLSNNYHAPNLILENINNINYSELSGNSSAVDIIKNLDPDKIDFSELSRNRNAIGILNKNIDKIDWDVISANPMAIGILNENLDKINWEMASDNYNIMYINTLWDNLDKLDWEILSANPGAIEILLYNFHKISWPNLCENPEAIWILEDNKEYIDWDILSTNPYASRILEQFPDKINWFYLSANPCIFTIDYNKMKENNKKLRYSIIKSYWTNKIQILYNGNIPFDCYDNILKYI